ncbi:stage II sporulation protein M [Virgibacillus proomii]|jgi:stage II sporulation protein M|uniref:stage II sporulation protein M n=1 Tax=Virgibacillus proomii TaxID=84407 RepID=UPI000986278E|nr:stage II sporulation protein M [Virgibacillus proomii]
MLYRLKEYKLLIICALTIYFLSMVFGIYFGKSIDGSTNEKIIMSSDPLDYLKNNIKAILVFIAGLLTFGISSIIQLTLNGMMLGVGIEGLTNRTTLLESFLYILPHGLFEIPAIILAGAIGLYPYKIIISLIKGQKIKVNFVNMIYIIGLIVSLLVLAAFVESYITPLVINFIE